MKLIHSYEQLRKFYDLLPALELGEAHFMGLACRSKYLDKEVAAKFSRSQDGIICRKLVTEPSFNVFLRTMQQYELSSNWMAEDHDGNSVVLPSSSLAVYATVNPRDGAAAVELFMGKMLKASFSGDPNTKSTMAHSLSELLSCFQVARSRKIWLDLDFDIPRSSDAAADILIPFLKELNGNITREVISTRGGYHVLVRCDENLKGTDLGRLAKKYEALAKELFPGSTIEIKVSSGLVPVPGTIQGSYPVHFVEAEELG